MQLSQLTQPACAWFKARPLVALLLQCAWLTCTICQLLENAHQQPVLLSLLGAGCRLQLWQALLNLGSICYWLRRAVSAAQHCQGHPTATA